MTHTSLNRYNFGTVNSIDFLFSTLHTTSFPSGKIDYGLLNQLCASVTASGTSWGSNPPYLSAGKFNSLLVWFVRRGILYLLICSVRYFFLSVTGIQLCKEIAYFPVASRHLSITTGIEDMNMQLLKNNYVSAHLYTIQHVRGVFASCKRLVLFPFLASST